ncbi:MAG TPA: YbaB/EbfC family nucleoid-associated protein [Terriglobales bacterium]|nr:YbaB/EbfC family nucleoid-associated protein [Terriglobales bacterium]
MNMNFDLGQMQSMLGQARQKYDELRQKLAQTTVEATAGAGMVTVKMNGEKQVLEVKLDPEVVKSDPEMLPDLIRAAVNEAGRKVDDAVKQEMGGMLGGMSLPGLF